MRWDCSLLSLLNHDLLMTSSLSEDRNSLYLSILPQHQLILVERSLQVWFKPLTVELCRCSREHHQVINISVVVEFFLDQCLRINSIMFRKLFHKILRNGKEDYFAERNILFCKTNLIEKYLQCLQY